MSSLRPDWHHDKTVPIYYGILEFTASTQPILLRMGPQPLKVPHDTVLVLTIRFARSSSCHGPWIEVCSWWTLLFPLERCSRWYNPRKWHNTVSHILKGCCNRKRSRTRYLNPWKRTCGFISLFLKVCTTKCNISVWSPQYLKIRYLFVTLHIYVSKKLW
jgi:hypothetical protein